MIDATEIIIRRAQRADAVEVSDLLHRLGLNVPSKEEPEKVACHWDRLWDENPYYQVFKEPILYGWVMEHKQRIVGFFGSIPRVYHSNSELMPVAIASQWGVEKDYREHTSLLCEQFFMHHPIATKLVTTAIKPTGRIFGRFGGKEVPDPRLDTVFMVPLDLKKLVLYKYRSRSVFLRAGANLALTLIPTTLAYRQIREEPGFQEVDAQMLPLEFVRFWKSYLQANKGLIASRDADFVKWYHGTGNRGLPKRVFIHRTESGDIAGYASMMEEPVPENRDLKRYKIIDLLALDASQRKRIISQLIRIAYREKADVLEFHLPGMLDRKDIPVRTLSRRVPQFPVFYQTTDPRMTDVLENSSTWQISGFDGDTCLM